MNNVFLIMCTKRKLSRPAAAELVYRSPFFIAARRIAKRYGRTWFIISAKHGLLRPETRVEPYDLDLAALPARARAAWAEDVCRHLTPQLERSDRVVILSDPTYSEHLEVLLRAGGFTCECPLKGLPQAEYARWLTDNEHDGDAWRSDVTP